eukprot:7166397-Lingulodinium_polyedra.AAC.1
MPIRARSARDLHALRFTIPRCACRRYTLSTHEVRDSSHARRCINHAFQDANLSCGRVAVAQTCVHTYVHSVVAAPRVSQSARSLRQPHSGRRVD